MIPLLLIGVVALAFIAANAGSASGAPQPHPVLGPPGPDLPPPVVPQNAPGDGGTGIPSPSPGITPGTIFGQGQAIPQNSRQAAAVAMNTELMRVSGFREYDQPIYKSYQAAAGLTTDGFPGTHTMNSLLTDLASMNIAPAPVPIFAWKAKTGTLADYDGVNAPDADEWTTPAPN